ncbi:MAG: type 4a pilus biogenesis protein PilO [Desulfobacterales bacterium]|jgi:type IV pilus assembly protein PilO|nr:type 4a pilus biogenesis protein PilO [Desulfobacterales bacterium]
MDTKADVFKKSGNALLEKFEKLVLWQRVAMVAGLLVLLCGSAVWFLLLPKYEEISSLEQKLQGLEKKLATAKINAAELGKFQAKMQEAEAQFKIAMSALPEKEEIPALLTSVSKSGQEVGLEFLLFEPKVETRREFYAEIPVAMSIRGDYHNLAVFFDKVARLSRIVNINNITINRGKDVKDSKDLSTACTAVTYKFVEPPPATPQKPAPGAKPTVKPNDGKDNAKSKPNGKKI